MHYYGSSPETDLQWLREEVTKKESKKNSQNSTHKTRKTEN